MKWVAPFKRVNYYVLLSLTHIHFDAIVFWVQHSHIRIAQKKLNTRLEKIEEITFLSLLLYVLNLLCEKRLFIYYIVLHNWSKNEMSAVHGTRESKWKK